jgi:hypothetical protein
MIVIFDPQLSLLRLLNKLPRNASVAQTSACGVQLMQESKSAD